MGVFSLRALQQQGYASHVRLRIVMTVKKYKGRTERPHPDGARGMSRALNGNVFHRTVGHVFASSHAGNRCMHDLRACMSCVVESQAGLLKQFFAQHPGNSRTRPHVANMCAFGALDGVGDSSRSNLKKLLASSRADVCINHNTSGDSHSCILTQVGVGDSVMIMPHLFVDFIIGR